jgi:small subunit ribosomal protein S21
LSIKVEVRNGNLEKALRVLKKKVMKEGLLKEMKQKQYYEKPSDKRVRKAKEMRVNFLKNKKKLDRLLDR